MHKALEHRPARLKARPSCTSVIGIILLAVALVPAGSGCARRHAMSNARQPFVRELPETTEYVRLLGRSEGVSMRAGLVTLQPGEECGWHSTEGYEEIIICLAGAGEVATEGGGARAIAAGHYAYNPPQTRHNVRNTGPEPLRYIYVVAPAAAD